MKMAQLVKLSFKTHLEASQIYDELVGYRSIDTTEKNREILLLIKKQKP